MRIRYLFIPFALGLGSALIWVLGSMSVPAVAAPSLSADGPSVIEGPLAKGHVEAPSAPSAELHVCFGGCLYSSIQDAVDAAGAGDVIKVAAGTYIDVQGRTAPAGYDGPSIITQVVYISKTVTVRGGYTIDNWTTSDPQNNPTTLDAGGQGRVLTIAAPAPGASISPTVEGLRITGGDAHGLGGSWGSDAGGGVYVLTATAVISDNQVFGNIADCCRGGGLYLKGSDATLNGNAIVNNIARQGGGLYLEGSDITLTSNTVTSNTANHWSGGGLFLSWSDARLSGNTVSGNTAGESGGGLYLWYSDATLNGNTVTANTAGGDGGGLYLEASDTTLSGNTVAHNSAELSGGGLALSASAATLSGNTVSGNTAQDGGGLYLEASDATLTNNAVTDNRANGSGGGLYVEASSPRLLHTTIARNGAVGGSGDGSGVYIVRGTVALTNTILAGHSVGISVTGGDTVTVNGVLWHNTPITVSQPATPLVKVQNQHMGDPAFVDPDKGDYHIGPGSAAIDAGVDAGVDHDIDGEPRPQGGGYDLGADETGLIVTKHATPGRVRPGAPLTYTIRVTNIFDVELHATVTDTLPEHITLGRTSAGTLILPGGVVTWTPVSIPPQEVWTDTVAVTVEMGYAGPLVNVVEVTTAEGATGRYVHMLAPDLKVTKQAHAETVRAGKRLTYTIAVTNTGNFDLHATVTDTLPAHVTAGETAGGTTVLPGGKLVWTPVIPAPGGVWMETVVVTVGVGYAGSLTNLVEVTTQEGAMGEDSVTVSAGSTIYLPVVMRGFP